ncbi:lipase family protein [Xanthomonas campestris]|uniref:lipase family protein n=1 Tax=Xanthomonas campestris TaxID=339 RepID=UPI0008A216BE|nr:lipase family protein [Xanthomonas campestris]MEB1150948.1 lipase family protein [Xanthomonas campestris pv. campestris]MCC5097323.1 lipase family protein [Xanthomonas campestris]MEA9582830.1 lipase family protein [Xanthomonas campestris]MEA9591068.1 lipase family protein [Xanthomonas campestris]MEA9622727.1 lipase family protein [Xanthomonas campestris]
MATAATQRGDVISSRVLTTFTSTQIAKQLGTQSDAPPPRCNVSVAEIVYATVGVHNEPTTASAAVLIPSGINCTTSYPLLGWGQGAQLQRASSQAQGFRASRGNHEVISQFAAQGYAVVATDYLGIGKSTYPFAPHLQAAPEASAIVDALRAARVMLAQHNAPLSGKVMLSGFSSGAHAVMAAQREIETHLSKEFNLVASAPISGPYSLSKTVLKNWGGAKAEGLNALTLVLDTFTLIGMQHTYSNLYTAPIQVFQRPLANKIESLFPGKFDAITLGVEQLPEAKEMFQPEFVRDFASNPQNAFRKDLSYNDLVNWTPRTPTLLCGVQDDNVVPFSVAQEALADFKRNGSHQVKLVAVTSGAFFPHAASKAPCMATVRTQLLDKQR